MDIWQAIQAIAESAAAIIAAIAIYKTVNLQKRQLLLEQRQFLFPLWNQLKGLREINPRNPVWTDVTEAVNTLELVAVAWEGQLIDENIIRRMYRQLFISFYQNIEECQNPPPGLQTGKQMLLACPAVIRLHDQLMKELAERDRLTPIR